MYLTERLIGVLTYGLLLIIVSLVISFSKKERVGKILFLYTILLSVMAYFFVPNPGADLYRLVPIMHIYSQVGFQEIWNIVIGSSTPITIIYMYVIGKTNIDGLLPAVTVFFFYNNVFYILKRSALKYNSESKDVALALLLLMASGVFIEVTSGIRSMLAFSIIAVCFYKEIYENKSIVKNLLWYVIAALFHQAATALVIIRITFLVVQSGKSVVKRFLYILLAVILGLLSFTLGNQYYVSMLDKAYSYITKGTYSYLWEYILGGLVLLIILLIQIISFKCIKKSINLSENNLLKFSCLLSILIIVFCIEYNTFHRFTIFNSIISIPLWLFIAQNSDFPKRKKAYFRLMIILISIVMLLLASARGNLSSLKFFIL